MQKINTTPTGARAIAERFAPPPSRREVIAGGAVATVAMLAASITDAPAAELDGADLSQNGREIMDAFRAAIQYRDEWNAKANEIDDRRRALIGDPPQAPGEAYEGYFDEDKTTKPTDEIYEREQDAIIAQFNEKPFKEIRRELDASYKRLADRMKGRADWQAWEAHCAESDKNRLAWIAEKDAYPAKLEAYKKAEAEMLAQYPELDDDAHEETIDNLLQLERRMHETPAETPEDMRAKGSAILTYWSGNPGTDALEAIFADMVCVLKISPAA